MTPYQWILKIKEKHGLDSDYKAAQLLGVTRGALSNYKVGRRLSLDETSAVKVAELLGEKPEAILLDQYAETVKEPAARTALLDTARRLCVLC
jgi:predicted transcriptional regulator